MEIIGYTKFHSVLRSLILNINFSLPQLFFAGTVAGVTNTIILTPVERVKCLLQVIIKYNLIK
jgi:hypothetical protein